MLSLLLYLYFFKLIGPYRLPFLSKQCTKKCWHANLLLSVVGRTAVLRSVPQKATVFDPRHQPSGTSLGCSLPPQLSDTVKKCRELGEARKGRTSFGAACQCQFVWHLGSRPSKNIADITVPPASQPLSGIAWCVVQWFMWFSSGSGCGFQNRSSSAAGPDFFGERRCFWHQTHVEAHEWSAESESVSASGCGCECGYGCGWV